jgi:uncharacterized C2H2 Zn-finger protein
VTPKERTPRPRCPECDAILGALREFVGEASKPRAYVDPKGHELFRCPACGPFAVKAGLIYRIQVGRTASRSVGGLQT